MSERRTGIAFRAAAACGLVLLAVYGCIYSIESLPEAFDLDFSVSGIAERLRAHGVWAALWSVLLMLLHCIIPFPAELLAIANAMVFGPVWGFVITWVGAMLAACLAFGLARALGRPFVRSILPARQRLVLDAWAMRQGTPALLLSRLLPMISFNVVNYGAGLTAVSWPTFLWTTAIGIVPVTAVSIALGDQLIRDPGGAWMWLAALAAGAGLWLWLRQHRRR